MSNVPYGILQAPYTFVRVIAANPRMILTVPDDVHADEVGVVLPTKGLCIPLPALIEILNRNQRHRAAQHWISQPKTGHGNWVEFHPQLVELVNREGGAKVLDQSIRKYFDESLDHLDQECREEQRHARHCHRRIAEYNAHQFERHPRPQVPFGHELNELIKRTC